MKKLVYGLLIIALIAGVALIDSLDLLSGDVKATDEAVVKTVMVQGEGTVKVKPDIAYINVGVESNHIDAKVAQEENRNQMDAIVNALKDHGLTDDDIKTISYNIWRGIDYRSEKEIEEYHVTNMIEITIKNIDDVGNIIDVTSGAGANQINSIRFSVSDEKKYYNEALSIAMDNAKEKATSIMDTFGEKPNKPYKVIEQSFGGGFFREANVAYDAVSSKAASSTPISSGDLEIKASLSVEYDY